MSDLWFSDFGSTDPKDLVVWAFWVTPSHPRRPVLFYDQEPLFEKNFDKIMVEYGHHFLRLLSVNNQKILANSEISALKNKICRNHNFVDWYYFFHGFVALEWYRDFKYYPKPDVSFSKVFITLNHLVTKDRSYRLNLVARLIEAGVSDRGLISCQLADQHGSWKEELLRSQHLDKESKIKIFNQFKNLDKPLVLDTDNPHGGLSAKLNLPLMQSALWHIVGETVFYHDKLHLTEKIFKPIVARRPFILLAAPGNLQYLKSYGFKTFDRWIDESYDREPDHNTRVAMVVNEVIKLCNLSEEELQLMYQEMQEVLDYNFKHFYNDFKMQITTEMVDNFEKCLRQLNVGYDHNPERYIDISTFKRDEIIKRLSQ